MSEPARSNDRLAKYRKAMGEDLGHLYYALENEYFWLRLKWQEYVALFSSSARVNILNAAAPSYFHLLEDALSDDILMHIARLTDPAKSHNKKTNLTIRALSESASTGDSSLSHLVDTAVSCANFVTDWRNRRLAHRDLGLALNLPVEPLPPVTRDNIDAALDALHAVFSHVSLKHFRTPLDAKIIEAAGGAEALLYVLRDGIRFRQEQLDQFEAGDPAARAFEPLPP